MNELINRAALAMQEACEGPAGDFDQRPHETYIKCALAAFSVVAPKEVRERVAQRLMLLDGHATWELSDGELEEYLKQADQIIAMVAPISNHGSEAETLSRTFEDREYAAGLLDDFDIPAHIANIEIAAQWFCKARVETSRRVAKSSFEACAKLIESGAGMADLIDQDDLDQQAKYIRAIASNTAKDSK